MPIQWILKVLSGNWIWYFYGYKHGYIASFVSVSCPGYKRVVPGLPVGDGRGGGAMLMVLIGVMVSWNFHEDSQVPYPYTRSLILSHVLVASLMSLTASLVTTSRMQQCFNVMCVSCVYKVFSVPVSLLYSVENKTYYYYYYYYCCCCCCCYYYYIWSSLWEVIKLWYRQNLSWVWKIYQ